jgi:NADPH-dependent glutamate synthase beta subunit-like oxidoreductase
VVLTGGAEQPRDLPVPGRELKGVHFAMEFLPLQNRSVAGDQVPGQIMATGKHVVVIGGGDTGSDCVGTSNRHGAASVTQFELMPQPPEQENKALTWPYWPTKLRTSSSHEEGCERDWSVTTKAFRGDDKGHVQGAGRRARRVEAGRGHRPDADERGAGLRVRAAGRPGAVRDGLRRAGRRRARGVRRREGRARQRARDHRRREELRDQRAEGLRRRRHAPRPVAGGLGDPRRAPVPRARSTRS